MTRVAGEAPRHGGASFRAHLIRLLMRAGRWRTDAAAIPRDLRSRGVNPRFEMFHKAMGFDDHPPRDASEMPVEPQEMLARVEGNLPSFLEQGVRIADCAPDIAALTAAPTRDRRRRLDFLAQSAPLGRPSKEAQCESAGAPAGGRGVRASGRRVTRLAGIAGRSRCALVGRSDGSNRSGVDVYRPNARQLPGGSIA
jgi:hypothetical protein